MATPLSYFDYISCNSKLELDAEAEAEAEAEQVYQDKTANHQLAKDWYGDAFRS